jgi:hypothetical protein
MTLHPSFGTANRIRRVASSWTSARARDKISCSIEFKKLTAVASTARRSHGASGAGGTMKKDEYRVFYRTSATTHYIDLAKQTVEIAGNEARIVVNGQLTRCVVEDVERAAAGSQTRAVSNLYLRRKG